MCYEYEFWREQRERAAAEKARKEAEEAIRKARESAGSTQEEKRPVGEKEPATV